MSESHPQTFANHGRFDPWFHFVILPLLVFCFVASIVALFHTINPVRILLVVFTLAALLLAAKCRSYALRVQDRVIRLEERLRLAALLPESLKAKAHRLSEQQLIALRFAADEELPSLVERVLSEGLEPKAIKKAINAWKPDYWRV